MLERSLLVGSGGNEREAGTRCGSDEHRIYKGGAHQQLSTRAWFHLRRGGGGAVPRRDAWGRIRDVRCNDPLHVGVSAASGTNLEVVMSCDGSDRAVPLPASGPEQRADRHGHVRGFERLCDGGSTVIPTLFQSNRQPWTVAVASTKQDRLSTH